MAYDPHLSIADAIKQYGLPKSHRVHWSDARKADVVRAVQDRVISFHEARERYLLSRAEFEQWEHEIAPRGSKTTGSARTGATPTVSAPARECV